MLKKISMCHSDSVRLLLAKFMMNCLTGDHWEIADHSFFVVLMVRSNSFFPVLCVINSQKGRVVVEILSDHGGCEIRI